jgi:DNA-binding GntR family transcriptional regulator
MAVKAKSYGFIGKPAPAPRGNAVGRVVGLLREAIASMEMKPGEVIDKLALCERLGLSRFPVSEALARLREEGLVDIEPQRGTFVSRLRLADVRQNLFIRRALEAEAVSALARRLPASMGEALSRNLRQQRAAVAAEDRSGFHALDVEFHELLLSALDFPRVKAVVESARLGLDRVRRLLATPRRNSVTLAEHARILAALQKADATAAADAMRAHIDAVSRELDLLAKHNPQLFADLES